MKLSRQSLQVAMVLGILAAFLIAAQMYRSRNASQYEIREFKIQVADWTQASNTTVHQYRPNAQGDTKTTDPETIQLFEHSHSKPKEVDVTIDPETLRLSEHPDIDVRGKFQKSQIKKMCESHNFFGEHSLPTSQFFYWHLIFEDKQKILFCYVPKVGSSNMRRLLYYMSGNLPMDTVDKPRLDYMKYLHPATFKASLVNNTLTTPQKEERIKNYFKYMIVRHPLERVVSAFRDKLEASFNPNFQAYTILKKHRPEELAKWQAANRAQPQPLNISVTFAEFCQHIIETSSSKLDEHFQPSFDICHPCLVHYDFYGNFRNYSTDSVQLIKKFETDPKYYQNKSGHKASDQTRLLLPSYYQQLDEDLRMKLFKRLHNELLFYYTLYPSERNFHKELLGIDISVL